MKRKSLTRRTVLAGSAAAVSLPAQAARRHSGGAVSGGPPVQTIASVTVGGSSTTATFTAATGNAFVGTVVVTMSPASPPFAGTISLDGSPFNTEGFHLSGTTSGSNLLAPAGGLGAGTYSDVRIRASQSAMADAVINPSLTATAASAFFAQGVDFRATPSFVTDPANCYGETSLTANYPIHPQNATMGYESAPYATRDRNGDFIQDARLVGHANFGGAYRIDLPAPGLYYLRIAVGDAVNATSGNTLNIFDGTTLLTTITGDTDYGGFIDASNVVHNGGGEWITSSLSWTMGCSPGKPGYRPFTFATTILRVGTNTGTPVVHIFVSNAPPPAVAQVNGSPFPPENKGYVDHDTISNYKTTFPTIIGPDGGGVFAPLGNPNAVYFAVAAFTSVGVTATGSALLQWWMDGAPISAPISVPDINAHNTAPFVVDKTTLANGNHVFYCRVLDASDDAVGNFKATAMDLFIGTNTGPQDFIASCTGGQMQYNYNPSTPQVIHYNGVPNPVNIAWPYTHTVRPSLAGADGTGDGLGECIADSHRINVGGGSNTFSRGPMWGSSGTDLFLNGGPINHGLSTELGWNGTLQDVCQDGDRFNNLTLAYSMFRDKEDGTGWIGIDYAGRLYTYSYGGAVRTLVGPHLDPAHLSFPTVPDGSFITPADYAARILPRCIVEGTLTGGITLQSGNDLVLDPRNKAIVYVACQVQNYIARVDTSVTPAVATIYAGAPGVVGDAVGPALSARFDNPSSIDMLADGTMYVCDFYNCAIKKISPDGSTVTYVAGGTLGPPIPSEETVMSDGGASSPTGTVALTSTTINFPYWGRLTSTNTLVICESFTGILREINFAASTVRRINTIGGFGPIQGVDAAWVAIDVNKTGSVGPVDRIWMASINFNTGGSTDRAVYYCNLDGTGMTNFATVSTASPLRAAGTWGYMGKGYFNWTVAIHRTENRMILNWIDYPAQLLYSWIPSNDNYVNYSERFHRGWYTFKNGSCADFPWDNPYRPSFCILYGDTGISHLGLSTDENTFEDLINKYPDDASLGAFIQGGMIGHAKVPRPELTGNHLRDLIYFIRRGAYATSYPTPAVPGPNHPDSWNYPTILTLSFTRINSSTVQANWTTDKPTVGFAGGCSSYQNTTFGELRNHALLSAITPTYSTSGTATINNAPFTPLHVIVVVKDVAGNITYSNDTTVS